MNTAPAFRLGTTLNATDQRVATLVEQALAAETAGYDDVWLTDVGAPDTLIAAAAVAQATQRVRIGTAVVPVWTRSAPVLAASCRALQEISDNRFTLGLGSSSAPIIEGWHGLQLERPLTRVRETVELLRSIQRGETTHYRGQSISSKGYRQAAFEVPIMLAALRPKMLELAAAMGDGVILNLFPAPALPAILGHIAAGAEQAGKAPGSVEVVARHQVCVTEDPAGVLSFIRQSLIPYFAQGVYNRYLAWCGYPEQADALSRGWHAGSREATRAAFPDALLREIVIVGDAQYCQARVQDYARRGIHCHVICCPMPDAAHQAATFRAFSTRSFLTDTPAAR